jgi:hypothetical protein
MAQKSPEEKLDLIKRNLQVRLFKDDITEILLKVALNTINQNHFQTSCFLSVFLWYFFFLHRIIISLVRKPISI